MGTSPTGSLRTVRESLNSYSSHHPTIGLTPNLQSYSYTQIFTAYINIWSGEYSVNNKPMRHNR